MNQITKKVMMLTMVVALFTMVSCKRNDPVDVTGSLDGSTDQTGSLEIETSHKSNAETSTEDNEAETSLEGVIEAETEMNSSEATNEKDATKPSNGKRPGTESSESQNDKEQGTEGSKEPTKPNNEKPERETPPWENGGKQPSEYTWKEYNALKPAMQLEFQNSFDSFEDFEAWMQKALDDETKLPWENGGKQPSEYTWAEYEALSSAEQLAFQNSFDSFEDFEAWMRAVSLESKPLPWENGGKQPSEYTWAEYEALTPAQQIAFQNSFASVDEFSAWMQQAQGNGGSDTPEEPTMPEAPIYPWDNGGKQPVDYTWDEYEALTPDLQMAFQNSFGSVDAFESWMQKAQGNNESNGSEEEKLPWENGGKLPSEYTWAEFEALTPAQQMAFQNWFSSIDEFDAWMQQAQAGDVELPWENGGKLPSEYTWAEFEALTPAQQMAFQNWFASIDEFDAWMQMAQGGDAEINPWEVEGAKQPDQYTWDEFEALTPGQQMAFQNWFGSWENFDKWLQANQP